MPRNAPPKAQTQVERRQKSEQALLDAAASLIAERGVEQTSLAKIGERAGASRGLPTHHFKSKDALVARLARRSQDRVIEATRNVFEHGEKVRDDIPALDVLRTMLDTYLELFQHPTTEERALIVMWGATFPSEASIDGMLEADQRSYDGLADLIQRGKQDGSIRCDIDARASAVAFFGMMRGVAALVLTESDFQDMHHVRSTCDAWIVGALAPTPTSDGSG